METKINIIDTTSDNILKYGICGYKNIKTPGFPEKVNWIKEQQKAGLKIKTLYSENAGNQGMIEYIPGENCWRPVDAKGYMFIQCIMVGFKREYKGKGYASLLLAECERETKSKNMFGMAVVTGKGAFIAGKEFFIKNGFSVVDKAAPEFELLVKKFNKIHPSPKFLEVRENKLKEYGKGLTIFRSDQCPYTVKNVAAMCESAENIFGIKPKIVDIKHSREARENPCVFGTFGIVYNGTLIADHPISNTRFVNIMNKVIAKNQN